jgi:glycosyltransferase involved in cell wall biosynthesis
VRVSVIVITRNRADSITETLQALAGQTGVDFEVLVVDSSEGAEKAATEKAVTAQGARFRYVHEPRRGQSLARNTGIPLASGEILAFTDDDCIPAPDWLAAQLPNYSDPAVWACTGRVVQHSSEGASQLFEEVAGQDMGLERRVFSPEDIRFGLGFFFGNLTKVFAKHMKSRAPVPFGIGHGSSMSFRRKALEQNGIFDERYGGGGCVFGGCEDMEMFYRTLKSGHSIVYEPAAVIRHKHRFSADAVFHTRYVYSYGGAAFLREHRGDMLMRVMFYGRFLQLSIKAAQYKLLRKKDLAKSFSSDWQGFRDGWKAHRKYVRECRVTGRSDGPKKLTAP